MHRAVRYWARALIVPIVIASYNPPTGPVELPDMQTDPEGYRAALKSVIDSGSVETYTDGQLVGNARSDGSVDVLLGRGTRELRVIRVNAGGKVDFEETLTDPMNSKQRPPWQDGYVTGNAVTLFGALGLKATRLPQGYATRFDLNSRELTTRLAPLDGPGLDMAIHARDEERQNLEHDPGQQPQILARLAGKPSMISSIKRARSLGQGGGAAGADRADHAHIAMPGELSAASDGLRAATLRAMRWHRQRERTDRQ